MSAWKLAPMRDWWLVIHKWLGLAVALFFAIASFTGGVLVYEHELDRLINSGRFPVTPGDAGIARVLDGALAVQPGARVLRIEWPRMREPVYQVDLDVGDGDVAERRVLLVDPGSGTVIEPTRARVPVLQVMRRTHTSLMLGRYGHDIVLYSSMLALFSLLTGLILWWPGVRRFFRGFAVRTRRGFYAFNFDLHQAVGAATLPLLFLITLSGILIPYERVLARAARPFVADEPGTVTSWAPVKLEGRTSAAESLPLPVLVDAAHAVVPDGQPALLRALPDPSEPLLVEFRTGRLGTAGIVTGVLLDPRDGSVLQVRDPRSFAPAVRISRVHNFNVHVGGFGGTPVRIIYMLVCFIGAGLAASGVLVWWLKRKKLIAVAAKRAERAGTGV
jgi:uncharacterized iron-regulated membrane protein